MKTKLHIMTSSKISLIASAIAISCLLGLALHAAPPAKSEAAAASQPKQQEFDTPKQAVDSLLTAAATFDVPALKQILGPDSEDLVSSEDPVADKTRALAFAAKAKEKNSVETDKKDPNRAILSVGNDDFLLPIPIVKRKGKWSFDTKVGREEILNRRIGANELNAIEICRGFVEAQHEYAQEKHDDSRVNQYAQHIRETRWSGVAESGWHLGRSGWRRSRQSTGGRLQGETRHTLSRLLLQGAKGARTGGAHGREGFYGWRCHDRWFRTGCSAR